MTSSEEEWAFVFQTLGEENLREILLHVAMTMEEPGEDYAVIEFDGDTALDITEHHQELESKL